MFDLKRYKYTLSGGVIMKATKIVGATTLAGALLFTGVNANQAKAD